MAKETKKERFLQAASIAHSARNVEKAQDAINQMLCILAKGTRYEDDVSIAFDELEKFHKAESEGRTLIKK